ncbi:sugar transferase [Microbacterium protaetiae]|uniref:Sugar transferase n=1 Tax=Microbacterium protaetiae TaxID=2509458 RepID=A0A4P6ECL9_9MICO|nr:sugar transferase [Microbacterium protaetiae]QAY59985.1 sugar transferase [Microbacterium protaetiae]
MTAVDVQSATALERASTHAAFSTPRVALFDSLQPAEAGHLLPFPAAGTLHRAAAVAPRLQPSLERRRLWERRLRRRLRVTDAALVIAAVAAAGAVNLLLDRASANVWGLTLIGLMTALVWTTTLTLFGTRSTTVLGSGAGEYKRVAHATGLAFGIVAMTFVVFQWHGVRMQLMVALPLGLFAVLVGRWTWRRWLIGQRAYGHYAARTLVTGTRDDVEYVVRQILQDSCHAFTIVGVALADASVDRIVVEGHTIPVVGTTETVADRARMLEADSVVVASRLDGEFIKRLSWELEGAASELILSSRLADVAGPRISLSPLDGMPLIHVKIPEFEGARHVLKRTMDVAVATLALIPITLIGVPLALLIKLEDHGPVFFRQTRIGRDGSEFKILKFRTMVVDAEARLAELQTENEGAGPLFKLKRDPRVTRIGAVLRKFSLDELPQFWNVLTGDMSVVGPRPPLPSEVVEYDGDVSRRLFIKPGITGLWQVSGRSDLSWDESVRLDLRYVENWSVMTDLMIMWRTARVMLQPEGAY